MLAVVWAVILILIGESGCDSRREANTSVCELAGFGGYFMDGRHVRLSAVFFTDGIERSALIDGTCPTASLAPLNADSGSRDASVMELDKELWSVVDDPGVLFVVDISGVYRRASDEAPGGAVTIERVWSIKRQHGDWRQIRVR
jgi:hypothetical protein